MLCIFATTNRVTLDDFSKAGEKSPEELYGHLEGFEFFDGLCPRGEDGIHTIESIKIIEVIEEMSICLSVSIT